MAIQCRVCGKDNPEHIFHCTEHYHCADCGTKERLCTYAEAVLCSPCHAGRVQRREVDFQSKLSRDSLLTSWTPEVVCPHCGHEHSDSWEMSDGRHECSDCCKPFEITRNVETTYSTQKA